MVPLLCTSNMWL